MTGPPPLDFAQLYRDNQMPGLADVNGMSPPEALAWYRRNGYHVRPAWSHPSGYRALVMPPGQRYSFDDLEPPSAAEVAWLVQHWQPGWQLGMIMGERSGLWALDVDDMDQWQRFQAQHAGEIEPTAMQQTGSGKLHLVYQRPERGGLLLRQERWSGEFPGIEVKSKGFLIVAPSVHHKTGQPYRWTDGIPEPAGPSPRLLAARLPALEDELAERRAADLRIEAKARRLAAAENRQPVVLVSAADIRKRPMPPELVAGMMPAGPAIGTLFGDTGVYKSFLALNLMLSIGSGLPFLGRPVNAPGRCVYVMGEGQYDAGLRLEAALGAQPGFTDERLTYIEQAFPLSDEATVDDVIAQCQPSGETRLVVFDSMADFYGAADSENSLPTCSGSSPECGGSPGRWGAW